MAISLTVGMRNALTSLSDLQGQIETTNKRLATGKKVNSALDNALNYFTAEGLSSRGRALSVLKDSVGLGIKILQQADKALSTQKNSLENIEGQLRQALQSTGTNSKAVGNYAYASNTALVADIAAGTDNTRFQVGDTFKIVLGTTDNTTGVFAASATGTGITFAAGTTVQNVLDNINNDATLNVAGQAQRVRAYLNDSGNIVVEQAQSGAATSTTTYAMQIVSTNGSGAGTITNNVRQAFGISGDTNKTISDVISGVAPTQTQTVTVTSAANATRTAISSSFRELQTQLGNLARDAGYNGTNLLNGDSLRVAFNEDNTTALTTRGVRLDSSALGFLSDNTGTNTGDAIFNFQSDREINLALNKVRSAKTLVSAQQSTFANNFNILQNRQDYMKTTVSNLEEGSDLLTLADINEEGANLTSLQTRQQLSVTALALANQADQAILRLF
jgi:flagellin